MWMTCYGIRPLNHFMLKSTGNEVTMNKLSVFISDKLMPVCGESKYHYASSKPEKEGDEALIYLDSEIIPTRVMLLRSSGMVKNPLYLVDNQKKLAYPFRDDG